MIAAVAVAAALAASCPPASAADVPAATAQLVTVEAPSARATRAVVRLWRRVGGCWRATGGPWPARLGWNGVSADRHEGDGTTPAGTFPIEPTMLGVGPNPGVAFRYRRLRCGDWWNEDPSSPGYNTLRHVPCGTRPPFRVTGEPMWRERSVYPFVAVVGFNMHPVVPGRGSGIFLHVMRERPTSGCVALRRADLLRLLRSLRPDARPQIAIGTRAELAG